MHVVDGVLEVVDSGPGVVGSETRGTAVSRAAVPGDPVDGDPVRREAVPGDPVDGDPVRKEVVPVGQSSYELVEQERPVGLVSLAQLSVDQCTC